MRPRERSLLCLTALAVSGARKRPRVGARVRRGPDQDSVGDPLEARRDHGRGRRRPEVATAAYVVGHPSFEGVWSTDDMRSMPLSRPKISALGRR